MPLKRPQIRRRIDSKFWLRVYEDAAKAKNTFEKVPGTTDTYRLRVIEGPIRERLKAAGVGIFERGSEQKDVILGKAGLVFKLWSTGAKDKKIIESNFEEHRKLFEMGAPVVEPRRFQVIQKPPGKFLIIWEEKVSRGESINRYIERIEKSADLDPQTKKRMIDELDDKTYQAQQRVLELANRLNISRFAFDLQMHNAIFDGREVKFTDIFDRTYTSAKGRKIAKRLGWTR